MPRYIAFLRGINVGGHRVKMDRLRALFSDLGLRDVSTFIASGNVSFLADRADGHALRDDIEAHLEAELGYPVAVFLRSPAELAAILEHDDPKGAEAGSSHYVIFFDGPVPRSVRGALATLESSYDRFEAIGSEVHWRLRGKLSASPLFGSGIERALGSARNTSRNINTLRRISAKTSSES